jgi:hypothetical protein
MPETIFYFLFIAGLLAVFVIAIAYGLCGWRDTDEVLAEYINCEKYKQSRCKDCPYKVEAKNGN